MSLATASPPPLLNPCHQRGWSRAPLSLLVAILVSLAWDVPVAASAKQGGWPRWVSDLLENAEVFGHGIGVALILLGMFVLDPGRRRVFPAVVAASLGAGLAANVLKLAIPRTRPRDITDFPTSVWGTFDRLSEHTSQSFPSAHTATAVGLAVALSACYPRGRWYFTGMAILVGMQRIHVSAHFPSDVFAGAAVGWSIAVGILILECRRHSPETSAPDSVSP